MVAALTPDRKFLTVAVVNGTESAQHFDLNVTGARLDGQSTVWQLTGKDVEAQNRLGQPPQVEVKETAAGNVPQGLTAAPISVSIYRFAVATSAP
jgi:alpha-N-arabinofuranosidase